MSTFEVANASPQKDFFIHTITKDITLEDAILDLLDNCIDGARNDLHRTGNADMLDPKAENKYEGYSAKLALSRNTFSIEDNCGGIPIDLAADYAFHFGRAQSQDTREGESIGLYGIGMKRALFKIGNNIKVESSTRNDAFEVNINLQSWKSSPDNWSFDMEEKEPWDTPGTRIYIEDLNEEIANQMSTNAFLKRLYKTIARDYSFIIDAGFGIDLADKPVHRYKFELQKSNDFKPARRRTSHADVDIEIVAGMAEIPPEDPAAELVEAERRKKKEYYGWFIICNDRVVVAADKSDTTVWGHDTFPSWHTQYYGFMGLAFFNGTPEELPWTTSKRGIDESQGVYRHAREQMKRVTKAWTEYTEHRKDDYEEAKKKEKSTSPVSVRNVEDNEEMETPTFKESPKVEMANVNYKKPKRLVEKVGKSLSGGAKMSYRDVGKKTFEYYVNLEL